MAFQLLVGAVDQTIYDQDELFAVKLQHYTTMNKNNDKEWTHKGTIAEITNDWLNIKAERWQDDKQKLLEYWRVERSDSLIIIPVTQHSFILPHRSFRPGVRKLTWDFPGGRIGKSNPRAFIEQILERELNISSDMITSITAINDVGLNVDSSFSDQKLWGLVARISDASLVDNELIGKLVPNSSEGVQELLKMLDCLQCRSLLLEYILEMKCR